MDLLGKTDGTSVPPANLNKVNRTPAIPTEDIECEEEGWIMFHWRERVRCDCPLPENRKTRNIPFQTQWIPQAIKLISRMQFPQFDFLLSDNSVRATEFSEGMIGDRKHYSGKVKLGMLHP
jgi:hypothetical protein